MGEEGSAVTKTPLTDEERLALCQKLDKDLDEFIDSLEKKRYTEGWKEDTWEEEMEKHPFFMKSTPNSQLSPLAEGLAKLKYDPDENTTLELATNYKDDGNFNFKHKNYRLAIMGYTEGIKVKCNDAKMNASLYNNRAAAHWHLKNYRSALIDSLKALSFDHEHTKARIRAAKSAFECKEYDVCIDQCDDHLKTHVDKDIMDLMSKAEQKRLLQQRDKRKSERLNQRNQDQKDKLIEEIIKRKIKIAKCEDEDDIDLSKLEPCLPGAQNAMVHLEDGHLFWPILLLYPEYKISDFVKECPENVPLLNHLEKVFPAPWDEDNKYSCSTVNVYYEGYDKKLHKIDPSKNLGDLLIEKYYHLKAGTPAFYILRQGSVVEKRLLESM